MSDRDEIDAHWERIFRLAEQGFRRDGKGAVFISDWDGEFVYLSAAKMSERYADPNLRKAMAGYDPAEQAIVVVAQTTPEGERVYGHYELRRRRSS